jgi:hypothetical protein
LQSEYQHFEYLKRKSEKMILKLAMKPLLIFHGGLSDSEQQNIIEDFGKQDSAVKYCYVLMQVLRNLHYFVTRCSVFIGH